VTVVEVRFIGQPDGEQHAQSFIWDRLESPDTDSVRIATAWAHAAGVEILSKPLRSFRERGGRSVVLCGLSRGGATVDGLEAVLRQFDEAYVSFDPTGRTIHSKIYLFTGPHRAALLVGSQNLTRSGLVTNHEAGLAVLANPDAPVIQEATNYLDRLQRDAGVTRRLTPELLLELQASPQISFALPGAAVDPQPRRVEADSKIFRGSARKFVSAPRIATAIDRTARGSGSERPQAVDQAPFRRVVDRSEGLSGDAWDEPSVTVVRRWYKARLKRSDARRPSPRSNPTNHLTLTEAGHDIDRRTWFHDKMFGGEHWVAVSGVEGKEHAQVKFEVVGLGTKYEETMRVTHNMAHESGQGNRTTSIEWGQQTRERLSKHFDVIGQTLTLERFADGHFRITFANSETGPAIL